MVACMLVHDFSLTLPDPSCRYVRSLRTWYCPDWCLVAHDVLAETTRSVAVAWRVNRKRLLSNVVRNGTAHGEAQAKLSVKTQVWASQQRYIIGRRSRPISSLSPRTTQSYTKTSGKPHYKTQHHQQNHSNVRHRTS